MTHEHRSPAALGSWFEKVAPFHIVWDETMGLLRISANARKYFHSQRPELEHATLQLLHPYVGELNAAVVAELTEMTLYIGYAAEPDRYLRGEMLWSPEHYVWMFTGLPPLKAIQDTKALGVSLRDLHFHLGVADFLIAHEAANVSLQEALAKNDALLKTSNALEQTLADLQMTQNALVQQERFKALGEMVSGIAHDFGNLLVPIMTYSSILKEEDEIEEDERSQFVDIIHTASIDAAELLKRLRGLYKPELNSVTFARFELTRVVKDAVALAGPRWASSARRRDHGIEVQMNFPDDVWVTGAESEVRQALLNVLMNAADAMPEGGVVSIDGGRRADDVWIGVRDSGVGMDDTVLAHCRDPLFSTKGARGSGLGLAMVTNCVMRHGGQLLVSSSPGVGTEVVLVLAHDAQSLEKRVEDASKVEAARSSDTEIVRTGEVILPPVLSAAKDWSGVRLLLVDDDEVGLSALLRASRELGISAQAAATGDEALTHFRRSAFDVVIADVDMPGMRGDDLIVRLRELSPQSVLVLYTGRPEAVCVTALPAAQEVLAKPMDAGQVIRRAMRHWAPANGEELP